MPKCRHYKEREEKQWERGDPNLQNGLAFCSIYQLLSSVAKQPQGYDLVYVMFLQPLSHSLQFV